MGLQCINDGFYWITNRSPAQPLKYISLMTALSIYLLLAEVGIIQKYVSIKFCIIIYHKIPLRKTFKNFFIGEIRIWTETQQLIQSEEV